MKYLEEKQRRGLSLPFTSVMEPTLSLEKMLISILIAILLMTQKLLLEKM